MLGFIVYRNPLEKAFWESSLAFPMFVGAFVAFIVAVIFGKSITNVIERHRWTANNRWHWADRLGADRLTLAVAVLTFVAVTWLMM